MVVDAVDVAAGFAALAGASAAKAQPATSTEARVSVDISFTLMSSCVPPSHHATAAFAATVRQAP